jgi:maltose 6'-phosphate phosphatase
MNSIIKYLLLLVSLIVFYSCNENKINEKPIINIADSVQNLEITIIGSITDNDGEILAVEILWGDNSVTNLTGKDFINILEKHSYSENANFTIKITATDDFGESSTDSFSIITDFPETSLTGIKETLFKTSDNEILILTLNLHTYQESNQNLKLNLIADVIGKMDIDFVAFQECGQNISSDLIYGIIREDNMAYLISEVIEEKFNIQYDFVWNWAHYGWNVWEEGVAVLSKHLVLESESKYISTNTSTGNIESRKVIYAAYNVPEIGQINFFSAHTHWRTSETSEEQNNQIRNIKTMVNEKETLFTGSELLSIVCGDFNGNPTSTYPWSEGYYTLMETDDYKDSFLEIYNDANTIPSLSIYNTIGGDFPGRIDYIFMKNNSDFIIVDSQIIFKSDIVGTVSDHYGVLTKIRFLNK